MFLLWIWRRSGMCKVEAPNSIFKEECANVCVFWFEWKCGCRVVLCCRARVHNSIYERERMWDKLYMVLSPRTSYGYFPWPDLAERQKVYDFNSLCCLFAGYTDSFDGKNISSCRWMVHIYYIYNGNAKRAFESAFKYNDNNKKTFQILILPNKMAACMILRWAEKLRTVRRNSKLLFWGIFCWLPLFFSPFPLSLPLIYIHSNWLLYRLIQKNTKRHNIQS